LTPWIRVSVVTSFSLVTASQLAHAQQNAASSTGTPATSTTPGDLDEIVVNGIKRGELIMPTEVSSSSAYGLDLGVMDTPRNNSLISKAQLDALNIQNPGGFSYLTSSSYSDASFGVPNVPKIRGQYADIFYDGMRDPFTLNGYGAPISFNDVDSIDIVKGTASVQQGPGAGVGGVIAITTKEPSFNKWSEAFNLEADTQQKRRASFDVGGPVSANTAVRVSFASDDSGSYYYDMYFHQQSFYAAVQTNFTDQYSVLFKGEAVDSRLRENDGVNRVNQGLIDNGTYLTGAPAPDTPTCTPFVTCTINGFGTPVTLTGAVRLNPRILIDEPAGTGAHALKAMGQIIQTFKVSDDFSIVNNSFYDYLNRYNQTEDYYADTAKGSYVVENKTDFKVKFNLGAVSNQLDAGITFRFEHIDTIQNFAVEPVSVFDLSGNPASWVFPPYLQGPEGDAVLYNAAFNHPEYGVSARDTFFANNSVIDNLKDGAIFLEHRLQFSPQWSLLYGLREDIVQLNEDDPLGNEGLFNQPTLTQEKIGTSWYGLHNGNLSVVYSPTSHVSTYLTYDNAQYVLPNSNDGGIATYGVDGVTQLRQNSDLEEAGLKFDLLDKALFISTAAFKQTRAVSTGIGGSGHSVAHIKGVELELNYQPDPKFFATASYSYLHTLLDTAAGFYNFPAQLGLNIDGAANAIVWNTGQRFQEPDVPQHLFNALVNYKHESGFGAQANLQVTGPIKTTTPGYINIAATNAAANTDFGTPALVGPGGIVSSSIVSANGLYTPPTIPWQYTLNAGVFYTFQEHYNVKFMVYNLTSRHNLEPDYSYYGNDFLTRVPPRSYDLTLSGKF
jgi:outer membrane receptor protein involved in Fe transport